LYFRGYTTDHNYHFEITKTHRFSLFVALALAACNSKSPIEFSGFTQQYFDDKKALFPLEATQYGQNQYNDQLLFEMTDSYRKKLGEFYANYEKHTGSNLTSKYFTGKYWNQA
jgi:hypothetical protein